MLNSSFARPGGELRLSNLGQLELLRGLVERGKTLRTRVRGFSMAPFIRDGDVITVVAIDGHKLKVGEVTAFTQSGSGRLAIHRIIARESSGWLLRGDNSPGADGVIACDRLIGRVTRVERRGHTIRLGLGVERWIIAWLVRHDFIFVLKMLFHLPRRIAGAFLFRLQNYYLYRVIVKRLFKHVSIVEATDGDMQLVHAHFNPNEPIIPENPDPNVTNYVAKRTAKVLGFVQLVRHVEPDIPMKGHWLFSLTVWGRYRGLGVGESLTKRVIDRSVLDGASELLLLVFQDNIRAICLYRKLGFEQILLPALEPQLEMEKLQHGRRRVVMRKQLTANR